jgi:hypothetical protein
MRFQGFVKRREKYLEIESAVPKDDAKCPFGYCTCMVESLPHNLSIFIG